MDNVNLQGDNKVQAGWKSFSLQRGCVPPQSEEEAVARHQEQMIAMRTNHANNGKESHGEEQEDPYGRCTNMRLTSFTDKGAGVGGSGAGVQQVPRDPRLIDLSQSAASTGNLGAGCHTNMSNGQAQGYNPNPNNFNTLPAHMSQQHQVRDGRTNYMNCMKFCDQLPLTRIPHQTCN